MPRMRKRFLSFWSFVLPFLPPMAGFAALDRQQGFVFVALSNCYMIALTTGDWPGGTWTGPLSCAPNMMSTKTRMLMPGLGHKGIMQLARHVLVFLRKLVMPLCSWALPKQWMGYLMQTSEAAVWSWHWPKDHVYLEEHTDICRISWSWCACRLGFRRALCVGGWFQLLSAVWPAWWWAAGRGDRGRRWALCLSIILHMKTQLDSTNGTNQG